MKYLRDIIPDRRIIQCKNQEFAGLEYEEWKVGLPVFSDQIETLLENGCMVSIISDGIVTVDKQLNPSPQKLQENKHFWRELKATTAGDCK
jgi:hypothetical protein